MTSKKGFRYHAITAMIFLATSNVVFAEDYQLPATVNNPVVMPVGADDFQNGIKNAIIKDTGNVPGTETTQTTKPTTALPSLSPASSASPAVNEITEALSKNPTLVGYQQQAKSGNFDSYGRPAGKESQQNEQNTRAPSKSDELYVEARNRYKEVQR
ncbi:TrhK, partial [Escherichia coli]